METIAESIYETDTDTLKASELQLTDDGHTGTLALVDSEFTIDRNLNTDKDIKAENFIVNFTNANPGEEGAAIYSDTTLTFTDDEGGEGVTIRYGKEMEVIQYGEPDPENPSDPNVTGLYIEGDIVVDAGYGVEEVWPQSIGNVFQEIWHMSGQSKIEEAQDKADLAEEKALEAKADAEAAQSSADTAQSTAETAQATADEALELAGAALDLAETAQGTALEASGVAGTALSTAIGAGGLAGDNASSIEDLYKKHNQLKDKFDDESDKVESNRSDIHWLSNWVIGSEPDLTKTPNSEGQQELNLCTSHLRVNGDVTSILGKLRIEPSPDSGSEYHGTNNANLTVEGGLNVYANTSLDGSVTVSSTSHTFTCHSTAQFEKSVNYIKQADDSLAQIATVNDISGHVNFDTINNRLDAIEQKTDLITYDPGLPVELDFQQVDIATLTIDDQLVTTGSSELRVNGALNANGVSTFTQTVTIPDVLLNGTLLSSTLTGVDTRITTLEDYDLDTRVTTLEDQTLDTRLTTLEDQTLDTRLTTLEDQTLDTRLTTLEDQTLDTRLTTLENYDLDTRVTNNEIAIDAITEANLLELFEDDGLFITSNKILEAVPLHTQVDHTYTETAFSIRYEGVDPYRTYTFTNTSDLFEDIGEFSALDYTREVIVSNGLWFHFSVDSTNALLDNVTLTTSVTTEFRIRKNGVLWKTITPPHPTQTRNYTGTTFDADYATNTYLGNYEIRFTPDLSNTTDTYVIVSRLEFTTEFEWFGSPENVFTTAAINTHYRWNDTLTESFSFLTMTEDAVSPTGPSTFTTAFKNELIEGTSVTSTGEMQVPVLKSVNCYSRNFNFPLSVVDVTDPNTNKFGNIRRKAFQNVMVNNLTNNGYQTDLYIKAGYVDDDDPEWQQGDCFVIMLLRDSDNQGGKYKTYLTIQHGVNDHSLPVFVVGNLNHDSRGFGSNFKLVEDGDPFTYDLDNTYHRFRVWKFLIQDNMITAAKSQTTYAPAQVDSYYKDNFGNNKYCICFIPEDSRI